MATVSARIGPTDQGRRMSLEEFHEAEDLGGYRSELVGGVLEVTKIPGEPHWLILDHLHEGFSAYRRTHPGLIRLIGHGSDVRFIIPELETDRHPDLAIALRGAPRDAQGNPRVALAVEIVSPGSRSRKRDYEDKRADYLAFGLLEYWIVDPKLRQVTMLARRADGSDWDERVIAGDGTITSDLLPGFALPVADLWIDVDLDDDDSIDL